MASSRNPTVGFDPFGWLEKWIPTRYLHRLIQGGVIVILVVFLVHRIGQYKDFLVKPLWVVETLIFVAFLLSYAIRMDPLERSRGLREIVVPLIGAALPFALLWNPPNQWIASSICRLHAVLYWMTTASSLGNMDPAPLFQHYRGSPCPGNERPLSLGEAPDLLGGDADSRGGPGMAIFPAEPGCLYYLRAGSDPENQMGRRKAHENFPRIQRFRREE
jgi:hypothetical protein